MKKKAFVVAAILFLVSWVFVGPVTAADQVVRIPYMVSVFVMNDDTGQAEGFGFHPFFSETRTHSFDVFLEPFEGPVLDEPIIK